MMRAEEIGAILGLVEQILARLPHGPIAAPVMPHGGDLLAWVALAADGTVRRGHLRDPSWFQ